MTLIERLPDLSDVEVTNLLANARRLSEGEDAKRKAAADELMPALEQEAESRAAAKAAALAEARAARTATRRKTTKAAAKEVA